MSKEPFKVIIAGGRDFANYGLLKTKCNFLLQNKNIVEIVSGTANGADKLGERYAVENGFHMKRFPAEWTKYGKSAGYRRNAEMADYADALIAFWDGESRGTKHMIDLAQKKGILVRVIKY